MSFGLKGTRYYISQYCISYSLCYSLQNQFWYALFVHNYSCIKTFCLQINILIPFSMSTLSTFRGFSSNDSKGFVFRLSKIPSHMKCTWTLYACVRELWLDEFCLYCMNISSGRVRDRGTQRICLIGHLVSLKTPISIVHIKTNPSSYSHSSLLTCCFPNVLISLEVTKTSF